MGKGKNDRGGKGAGGGLTPDDLALWRLFTHDIEPLHDIDWGALEEFAQQSKDQKKPVVTETAVLSPIRPSPSLPAGGAQIDRRTEEKIRRGKMDTDARIDLHGHTQERAYDALRDFITASHRRGLRCVLVITGKGRSGVNDDNEWRFNDGVLRARLPEWLSMPPLSTLTLKYFPAQPKDGGDGAFYVYLRRTRDYSP